MCTASNLSSTQCSKKCLQHISFSPHRVLAEIYRREHVALAIALQKISREKILNLLCCKTQTVYMYSERQASVQRMRCSFNSEFRLLCDPCIRLRCVAGHVKMVHSSWAANLLFFSVFLSLLKTVIYIKKRKTMFWNQIKKIKK